MPETINLGAPNCPQQLSSNALHPSAAPYTARKIHRDNDSPLPPHNDVRHSQTHLIVIPTYNTGRRVIETVCEARRHWSPVWVVVDGSTDGSGELLQALAQNDPDLRVLTLPRNAGKGAAVLHALREAAAQGYSHALVMDADGQHPAANIAGFMEISRNNPEAQILGLPVFDATAPAVRVQGRKLSNFFANLETHGRRIGDSLFGFRVYPIAPLLLVMAQERWMRGFDFDPEAAVRLCWRGVRPINIPAPVRYFRRDEGGVSHFNYLRDNLLLMWMHLRLLAGALRRLPLPLLRWWNQRHSET
jgi:glycosyltransferase involved in cell wall biosynthesis